VDARTRLPDSTTAGTDLASTVATLQSLDLAAATDVGVITAISAWQQVVDAATAAQAAAISELSARRPASRDGVSDEVALALTCTRRRATHLIGRAHGLDEFAVLRRALAAGLLDAAKVDLLLDEVACLPDDEADAVLHSVLDDADGLTTTQLRRLVRRRVVATRPEAARARAAKARRERCVQLQHGPDAMAWVHAYLPAPDAVAMFGVVDALACAQRARDDDRDVDQRRADALSGLFAGILATGALPDGTPLPTPQGHRVGVQVAVAATTLLGLDELPGELLGYGPIPASMARDLARDGTWRRVLTDAAGHVLHLDDHTHPAGSVAAERPLDGGGGRGGARPPGTGPTRAQAAGYRPGAALRRYVLVRDQVCAFAGCAVPAWRCDLDHALPYDGADPTVGPTCACNLRPLCRRHHRLKTHAGWSVTHDRKTGFTATTSPTGFTYLRPSPTLLLSQAPPGGSAPAASRGSTNDRPEAAAPPEAAGSEPSGLPGATDPSAPPRATGPGAAAPPGATGPGGDGQSEAGSPSMEQERAARAGGEARGDDDPPF